ncbi:hypothetical protein LCGC14_0812520 [marine sediment metagenome]|uniref:Uncharacterized protein n=1 Tax=marine sediment metagenome TaxID=412755 RepID=A0A0F9Q6I7_9ZZZZ
MARKKIVKPTLKEAKRIKAKLQRQYPQMFEYPAASRAAVKHLSPADREAILEKTTAKRLKKAYRSNK